MKRSQILLCGALGASVLVNLVLLGGRLERIHAAKPPKIRECTSSVVTNVVENKQMRVVRFDYDGEKELQITFSHRPELSDIRRYVSVSPLASGIIGFDYRTRYNWRTKKYDPVLAVTGDFAFRTNLTCVVRRGLVVAGKVASATPEETLQEDATYDFRRKDQLPSVSFASKGRYLPPCGARALALTCINTPKVVSEIRRVEPRNLVQLMAREESVYDSYYGGGGDSRDTKELAGEAYSQTHTCKNVPNVPETVTLPVSLSDGGATNGVYLVSLYDGRDNKHRLVCVSDLALSVRRSGQELSGVWVTSLTTGLPVAQALVEVYSAKGIRVAEGSTDARGLCTPTRLANGEPFVVIAYSPEAMDMTFLALSESLEVDERAGTREAFLNPKELTGFAWTDRGIYRPGEKIFFQVIVRNGEMKAPKPFPVCLELVSPKKTIVSSATVMSTDVGTVSSEDFSVPADQPSGSWTLRARLPGANGRVLAQRVVKVEEFAIPQVRVALSPVIATETNLVFDVSGDYLFGSPARQCRVEGAIVFEDAPFAPAGWSDYHFGNDDLGLTPNFLRIEGGSLDAQGHARLEAPRWDGRPKAMVKATAQGVVFEDGGRPSTARRTTFLHAAPFYIGAMLERRAPAEPIHVACVAQDAKRLNAPKRLTAKLERYEMIYAYQEREEGWTAWNADRLRVTVAEDLLVEVPADADGLLTLPRVPSGDYALTITDPETGVSFARTFYVGDGEDESVSAPLSDPTAITLTCDKSFYRVGEVPRLVVRSPFAGAALLSVFREKEVYREVIQLTNATSEVVLKAVRVEDAPNLDVYLSVVQSAQAKNHLAVRAHGQTTVLVRPKERELDVGVEAHVDSASKTLTAQITTPGSENAVATITLVDEGLNLLTEEKTPNPIGAFARPRESWHPLYDLYGRLLPVLDDPLKTTGRKTGGGFGAELLSRVSPVASRRFKPLIRWQREVPIVDGRACVTFELPEFVGEVRVTAVVVTPIATGSAATRTKIAPKLVALPDAPRFVAPQDVFEVKLPIFNESDAAGTVRAFFADTTREFVLGAGEKTNLLARVTAPKRIGELPLDFRVEGLGEVHAFRIDLPVRPAVAWVETNGWERRTDAACEAPRESAEGTIRFSQRVYDSPIGAYSAALAWLAEYPHGCLEQTSSRIFPLVACARSFEPIVTNATDYVVSGVRRVESMVRETDFVMWPDCQYAPWSREVSLYAAHFLFEAEASGVALTPSLRAKVAGFIRRWTFDENLEISSYAALIGVIAHAPERDRLYRLYDKRAALSPLARSRLALAFAALGDSTRAAALLKEAYDPASVKEAAFRVMALVALNPEDARILPLVAWLDARRDRSRLTWGTTEENAHALLAIGAYFRAKQPKRGETFVAWRKLELPSPETVVDEAEGICLTRTYVDANGKAVDLNEMTCEQRLSVVLALSSEVTREVNDLVIQDLFPGAFEPIHEPIACEDWVMRFDARDDRMLVYSKKFTLEAGHEVRFVYPVRVVSAGDFVLPGARVEGMYDPRLHACRAPGRLVVRP